MRRGARRHHTEKTLVRADPYSGALRGRRSRARTGRPSNQPFAYNRRPKNHGLWIGAADMDGETCFAANLSGAIALVIGSEGKGVSRLVKENCDFVVSIPMRGTINSLNASNAAAILMYEIRRQRDVK